MKADEHPEKTLMTTPAVAQHHEPTPQLASETNRAAAANAEAGHVVHFYENDDFLVEVVTEFLHAGLEAGEPLILIATESHRTAFLEALEAKGCDTKQARAVGALRLFDARDTLSKFMVDSMPDAALFKEALEPALREASSRSSGAPVRAYGEMVDLLWRDGNSKAAIRLEELWSDLQQQHPFSLLCAYVMASFYKEAGDLQHVCATHTHILRSERSDSKLDNVDLRTTSVPLQHARALSAEIAQRRQVERALREALKELRAKEEALRRSEHDLRDFVENATVGLHWVGPDGRILWANQAELELLGYQRDEYVGRPIADFHLDAPVIKDILARLAKKEDVHTYEARLRAKDGSTKHVLISSNVRWDGDKFIHTRCFTRDVTERKLLELRREASARRIELLGKVTAAIADAITPDEVVEAVVDQVAAALEASSAGLWLLDEAGRTARLSRAVGYSDSAKKGLAELSLDSARSIPAVDCARLARPIWINSQEELFEKYPHLSTVATKGRTYRIACLPIVVQHQTRGSLAFTFDGAPALSDDDQSFLMMVARHAGQALERLRLLDEERESRARAESAAVRLELLYGLAAAVNSADAVEQVFDIALDGIERALGARRSSILTFDSDGVMRFQGWRGLTEAYRQAVEGHSPWSRDVRAPAPILIPDVERAPAMSPYLPLFKAEGIGALGFIPLVSSGRLLGKFMVYYDRPRELSQPEQEVARAIADHVAAAISRFQAMGELRDTVRYNELFTGVLAHDLRNPLGAILTSAQLVLRRQEGEWDKATKPLNRIITSGERMTRMVGQLLDFTRARVGGGFELQPRPVDLADISRQVVDELEVANPEWKISLEHAGDLEGTWDPDRLVQVASNLVANAGQHGEAGREIRVRVDGTQSDFVTISVENRGVIPEALLGSLFDPFRRARHRREQARGLGLGLFITKEIVLSHGGSVQVSSTQADGTTFTIRLPRRADLRVTVSGGQLERAQGRRAD